MTNRDAFWVNDGHGGRYYPFSATKRHKEATDARVNANWKLFNEGKYISSTGDELYPSAYNTGAPGQFTPNTTNNKIRGTYTKSDGKTYTIFNQPNHSGTLGLSGCMIFCYSTIISAYDPNVTPEMLYAYKNMLGMWPSGNSYITYARSKSSQIPQLTYQRREVSYKSNEVKAQLQKGGYAVVHFQGTTNIRGDRWAINQHWVLFLDYDATKGIFVAESSFGRTGWYPLEYFEGSTINRVDFVTPVNS